MITVADLKKVKADAEALDAAKIEQYFSDAIMEEAEAGFNWKYFTWNSEILRSEIKPFLEKLTANGFTVVVTRQDPKLDANGKVVDVVVNEVFVSWGK